MRKYTLILIGLVPLLLLGSSISVVGSNHVIKSTQQTATNILQSTSVNKETIELRNHEFKTHSSTTRDIKKSKDLATPQLEGWIYTKCNGVEKRTPIIRGLLLPINVDNNNDTGPNGNDIQTRFYIYPSIKQEKDLGWPGIALALTTTVKVERLSEGITDQSLEIYLELLLPDLSSSSSSHRLRVGYYSPEQETIPSSLECSLIFKPYFFYDKKPEFTLSMNPQHADSADKKIILLGDHAKLREGNTVVHRMFAAHYDPMISTAVTISPGTSENMWGYTFTRNANTPSQVKFSYGIEKQGENKRELSLQIDELPVSMSFSLGLTPFSNKGGSLEYRSSEEYDVTLRIWGSRLGVCKEMQITNIPWQVDARWLPKLHNGYIDVEVEASTATEVIIADDLEKPEAKFVFSNLSTTMNATWNFGQDNGTFEVETNDEGLLSEIYWALQKEWQVDIDSRLKSEYLNLSWKMEEPGYLEIDTNDQWVASFSFEIKYSNSFGIFISAAFIKAEDYHAEWKTIMPPEEFSTSGEIEYMGNIDLGVMLQGNWYWIL